MNELALIALISSTTTKENSNAIELQLKEVEKMLDSRMKGQGWMTYFSRSSEVVSLNEVWKTISGFEDDARKKLIADIWSLKQQNSSQ